MIISLKAWNYKMFDTVEAKLNGESIFVVADSEMGKTTFIELIAASLGLAPIDRTALKTGTESGGWEVVHDLGEKGTFTVRYLFNKKNKKGSDRVEVISSNGGSQSLRPFLDATFGKAFVSSHFDYKKYFYELKTSDARFEYFIKCMGGEPVLVNKKTIKEKTQARFAIGGKKATYEALLNESIVDPETLEADLVKYKEEKKLKDIYDDPIVAELRAQLIDKEEILMSLDTVKELNEKTTQHVTRVKGIEDQILDFEEKIRLLKLEKKGSQKYIKENPTDIAYQKELEDSLEKADAVNIALQPQIDAALMIAEGEVNQFNQERTKFQTGLQYLETFKVLNDSWTVLQNDIIKLEAENEQIFKAKFNIPELSIGEDESILYLCPDGVKRELAFPNVSKGRSIRIAAEIQRILNPDGINFIVIPEGQSLGSGLYEVIEECKKFGFQYIVEITERKQDFKIVFEEEYLKSDKK